jgi:pimeloyl-ACP methyl ester carboxylesterase
MTSGSSTFGYGKSTRPKEMSEPPEANSPIATGDVAVKDIGSVVDFILRRRNISRLNLLGWSWGTTLMATYTTQNPGKVEKLILYAPVWIRQTASLVQSGPGKLGAYRTVTREQAKERWYTGVPEEKKGSLIPPGWFDAWADATFATDPVGAQMNPPVLRAPNGVVQDGKDFFGAGKPYYDPSKITVPTLLIDAEWDRDGPPYMAHTLFPLLVNSPGKRYVELAEGTHTIIMEKKPLAIVRGRAGLSGGGQPLLAPYADPRARDKMARHGRSASARLTSVRPGAWLERAVESLLTAERHPRVRARHFRRRCRHRPQS